MVLSCAHARFCSILELDYIKAMMQFVCSRDRKKYKYEVQFALKRENNRGSRNVDNEKVRNFQKFGIETVSVHRNSLTFMVLRSM
jgi:hypothetical protein